MAILSVFLINYDLNVNGITYPEGKVIWFHPANFGSRYLFFCEFDI